MKKIVELQDLKKDYTNGKIIVPALGGISLDINEGEFSVFAGPSGSGKTTLLNVVGAMDKPTGGKIHVAGKDISQFSTKEASLFRREKLGFIFQSYNLIPVLTAYENIVFSLDLLKKYSTAEKKNKVEKILDEVGILELRDRRPTEMSGGQQQRVAVARALVKEPSIILADEPTANLDHKTGTAVLDLMKRLNEEKGITFIFSSHDPEIIERAKRVIWLRDGILDASEEKIMERK